MKIRSVVKLLSTDGWYHVRTRGSHHQYKHSWKKGLVTVPGKPGDEISPKTLKSILKQAGLER